MIVSVFEKLLDPKQPHYLNATEALEAIRVGGNDRTRAQIIELREIMLVDPDRANELKRLLPGFCFGGKFMKRSIDGLIEASGLMIIDFDEADLLFSEKLLQDPYIWAFFLSPRGKGYKALVKIPIVKTDAEFKRYFYSFFDRYPTADPSGKDISRFCFFSYDPSLVIKEDAQVWTQTTEIHNEKATGGTTKKQIKQGNNVKSNYKKMAVGLTMIQQAAVGNGHNTILKAGRLMGGFIAAGEVDEIDVVQVFEREIQSRSVDPNETKDHMRTFMNGISRGKTEPLDAINELRIEEKIGKIDFTLSGDTWEKVKQKYDEGYIKGYHVGWDCLKEIYMVVLGFTTYLYGSPYSGKTQWLFEVLVNLSSFYGMKHCILSPETGRAEEVYIELLQIAARQDFTKNYGNQMSVENRDKAREFIEAHFIVVDPEEEDVDISIKDMLDYVNILERKYNTKIHTITIDPWNELEHEESMRGDLVLNKELKLVRRHAKRNNRHIFIINHVKDQQPTVTKTGETYYPIPTPRDLYGGQTWHRKGFMMLAFWRPFLFNSTSDTTKILGRVFRANSLLIQCQKAKPKGVGRIGETQLFYDTTRHTFYEENGTYSHKVDIEEVEKVEKSFVLEDPNNDEIPF